MSRYVAENGGIFYRIPSIQVKKKGGNQKKGQKADDKNRTKRLKEREREACLWYNEVGGMLFSSQNGLNGL